jgi:4a-hydroxytetrahydrobiopterin dehydratase
MAGNKWQEVNYYSDNDKRKQKALIRNFNFSNFADALEFVNKVGEIAEKANHHPDINLGWGYVKIWLTSHDEHGITEKDHMLAIEIDALKKNSL